MAITRSMKKHMESTHDAENDIDTSVNTYTHIESNQHHLKKTITNIAYFIVGAMMITVSFIFSNYLLR